MKATFYLREQSGQRRIRRAASRPTAAFSLVECLVYLSAIAVLLVVLATAFYHADWNNRNLSRNAADILRTLEAGERWRADVRGASGPLQLEPAAEGLQLSIPRPNGAVRYAFRDGAVWRQAGATGRWEEALAGVLRSRMEKDARQYATAWRWEVELLGRQKTARVRPLFSFEAVEAKR